MRLATVAQSREIDELSQTVYGLPAEILMESAGATAARELDQSYYPDLKRGLLSVVCGPGNNGGDGLVLARHLHAAGHRDLIVFVLAPQESRSELFTRQLSRVDLAGIRHVNLCDHPEKMEQIRSSALIVDALFGIGLSRPIESDYLKLVEIMNSCRVPVVSLDCPSGLDCDTGVVKGQVIKADMTLSFGLAKPGFFVSDGPRHVGKLRILPIGFPYESLRGVATSHFAFTERLARRYLPRRLETSNKSDHGHLLVLAGREGMWGAGLLASSSAYRMGTGYVTWASFESPAENILESPEILTGKIDSEELWQKKITAAAVGPGLGVSRETADVIERLKGMDLPGVVLDADAITTCVQFELFPLPCNWVLTPHMGELARILKKDVVQLENNRFQSALEGSETAGCHVLLKGFRSVVANDGRCMVINAGNSALAKAGTGDVLTGMIGGFMAQGLEPLQATATAAYIHGRLADEWVRIGHDRRTLMASDLRDHLPSLIGRIAGGTLVL
ncbi:MAG: NAD(P)H-hydrate dehydratase [Bdellovibrionaceae bacterium]|nr:NAD(P)H-hydrate dehydratase [Bdellovibrionales bacterium]MCB9083918.1 NAD(P)H-hydrate dehydratase [Pseudobdellovibrionaceae bacterium]